MKAFDYASPATVADAVRALAGSDSGAALSGGTDLLGRMKDYVSSPERIVYLKGVRSLAGIEGGTEVGNGLTLGAGTRLVDIVASKEVAEKYPALRQATLEVGTPQIRNMATLGGNLLQRPRCWYYRSGFGLLGMKDGKSLVRSGDNRYHAIFQTDGDALFVNPSSLAVPLIALGARATIVGKDGERTVAVEDLYRVPKTEDDRELTIAPGELLTRVTIPAPRGKNASYEARQKRAHDWPLVLCSVAVDLDGQTAKDARVVIYGVAPVPWRSRGAEQAIAGKALTPETAAAAGAA
ncbi:MAG TPA: FAD binding domain-containing protein, partial [Isosphaeraceae bacterium]